MTTRRMARALGLACALVTAAACVSATHAAPAACPAPTDLDGIEGLPALKTGLRPGGQLDVLVVGSALAAQSRDAPVAKPPSLGARAPDRPGYTGEMAKSLEAAIHGLHVTLTYDGGRFMSAADMLGVIAADLARQHYRLVIWQTGTADAVRDEPLGDFYQALSDGAAAAASAGAALVLVDPQFSRFLEANADIGPYISSMHDIGLTSGALLFDRYALMRDWAETGQIDLENAPAAQRPAIAARLHTCLGQELARTLLAAVAAAQ